MGEYSTDLGRHLTFDGERKVQEAAPHDGTAWIAEDFERTPVSVQGVPSADYAAFSIPVHRLSEALPVMLVGEDVNRKKVVISVDTVSGANGIIIGKMSQVAAGSGFFVAGGTNFTTDAEEPIYAAKPAGDALPTMVGVWVEVYRG